MKDSKNEDEIEKIKMMEDYYRYSKNVNDEIKVVKKNKFKRKLNNMENIEGKNVNMEWSLKNVGEKNMRVDWFVNGRKVKKGKRLRNEYEFEYVEIEMLGV